MAAAVEVVLPAIYFALPFSATILRPAGRFRSRGAGELAAERSGRQPEHDYAGLPTDITDAHESSGDGNSAGDERIGQLAQFCRARRSLDSSGAL